MNDGREEQQELTQFLGDASEGVQALAAEPGSRDFAAVVTMAHRLDPDGVSASAVEEACQFAPVIALPRERSDVRQERELDDFLADVQRHWTAMAGERRMAGLPLLRGHREAGRRRWAAAAAVVAAAVLLSVVGVHVQRARKTVLEQAYAQAPTYVKESLENQRQAHHVRPADGRSAAEEAPPAEPIVSAHTNPTAVQVARSEPARRMPHRNPTQSLVDQLAQLDRAAQDAWRVGDLPEAERLFARITVIGHRERVVELAYGDLFTLARQRGSSWREVVLWREYLVRFPNGQFSDDARAGLCRRASAEARADCWSRYLERAPRGAHRAQAERELEQASDR